jgi:hypothetical protein
MISLTLLYASLLPLCLHLILLIWPPPSPLSDHLRHQYHPGDPFLYIPPGLISTLPKRLVDVVWPYWEEIRESIRKEQIDEMWVATHLLSGMSSGLALRVLLPTQPRETMVAVLGGWFSKAATHVLLSRWVYGW